MYRQAVALRVAAVLEMMVGLGGFSAPDRAKNRLFLHVLLPGILAALLLVLVRTGAYSS